MERDSKEGQTNSIQIKKPKRVIHCSDGIYEEFSSDDEELKEDPKDMSLIRKIGHSIIFGLDYLGDGIANILNVSTPKYSYEIEQFKKMQEEREKEEREEKENTWQIEESQISPPITDIPKKIESPN